MELAALFWGAAFRKVPAGAWVPLMIGCILWVSYLDFLKISA
jgi:K+ transporter